MSQSSSLRNPTFTLHYPTFTTPDFRCLTNLTHCIQVMENFTNDLMRWIRRRRPICAALGASRIGKHWFRQWDLKFRVWDLKWILVALRWGFFEWRALENRDFAVCCRVFRCIGLCYSDVSLYLPRRVKCSERCPVQEPGRSAETLIWPICVHTFTIYTVWFILTFISVCRVRDGERNRK